MYVKAFGITDIGKVRAENEDSMLLEEGLGLFAVADGMGGHNCGEMASSMAVGILRDNIRRAGDQVSIVGGVDHRFSYQANLLASGIRLANRAIYEAAFSNLQWRGMGTTIAAVLFCDKKIAIAHVGDSRVYLLRDGLLRQITNDHSLVAEKLRKGLITEEEAGISTQKNIITRALGHDADVAVDLCDLSVMDGDRLLICSDGLTSFVSDQEISAIIKSRFELKSVCSDLLELANAYGGRDNITVILLVFKKNKSFLSGWKDVFKR